VGEDSPNVIVLVLLVSVTGVVLELSRVDAPLCLLALFCLESDPWPFCEFDLLRLYFESGSFSSESLTSNLKILASLGLWLMLTTTWAFMKALQMFASFENTAS